MALTINSALPTRFENLADLARLPFLKSKKAAWCWPMPSLGRPWTCIPTWR